MRLVNLFEQELLTEKGMSPASLSKEVQDLVANGKTPYIGVEIECIIPREDYKEYDPMEDPNVPTITDNTSLQDLLHFFKENTEDDFYNFKVDYEEWTWQKLSDGIWEDVDQIIDRPEIFNEMKIDFLCDDADLYDDPKASEILDEIGIEEIDRDAAEKILEEAQELTKKFGPPSTWGNMKAPRFTSRPSEEHTQLYDDHPYGVLYYEAFIDGNYIDEFRDKAYEYELEEKQYYDPTEDYTAGMFIDDNYRGIDTMYDFFLDNTDWLLWPLGSLGNEGYDIELANQIKNGIEGISDTEVEISQHYHGADDRESTWIIEEDSSIETDDESDAAFEIISPALEYEDAMYEIPAVFKMLTEEFNAHTNSSTGLHVNVSVDGINHNDVDYAKLVLLLGDKHILDQYDRLSNTYAMPSIDKLADLMGEVNSKSDPFTKRPDPKKYLEFMDKIRGKMNTSVTDLLAGYLDFGKYTSVGMKNNRIEFRSPGNTDYLKNWKQLESDINRFVSTYAISADSEAHKREYAKKLYKIMTNGVDPKDDPGLRFTKLSIQLFSLYSAGVIDKADLVQKLKDLQYNRQEAKQKKEDEKAQAEYNRAKAELGNWLAQGLGKEPASVNPMLQFALRTERKAMIDAGQVDAGVFTHEQKMNVLSLIRSKLEKDIHHYEKLANQTNNPESAGPDMNDKFNNAVQLIHQDFRIVGRGDEVTQQMIRPILLHAVHEERARGNDEAQAVLNAYRRLSADINYYRDTGIEAA